MPATVQILSEATDDLPPDPPVADDFRGRGVERGGSLPGASGPLI